MAQASRTTVQAKPSSKAARKIASMHMPVIMPHTEQVVTAVGLLASQQVGFTEAVGVVLGDPVSREEAPGAVVLW